MFYATADRDRTKLPRDPFKAIVAPRPIGWISTRALDGRVNLAPYSFFNGFCSVPPIVGFSSEGWKDSASFAKESGEFVANLATFDLRGPMNETSAPFARGDNEFARAGLTMAECRLVAAPRVAESPAALECKVVDVVEIKSVSGAWSGAALTLGEVVAFHIDDEFLVDGRFDTARAHSLARCGYQDYAAVEKVFALARPKGVGVGFELDAIAAGVIGGTSLSGGVGRMTGTVIGAVILGILTSGFTFLNVDAHYQEIIKGGVIVAAVVADQYRQRRRRAA
jgi:flavin reductase (DIM6/NTAB) family NADH-FMN oxidoreductase RutF